MEFTYRKKYKIYGLISLLLLGLLSGCEHFKPFQNETVVKQELDGKEMPLEMYVCREVKQGKYEPTTGLYTGAYVAKDDQIKQDILEYETLLGQKQTFKVFQYKASEGMNKYDILKCIAQKKIPYIKLVLGTDYELTTLYQMIFDIKDTYKTPIFIELYPLVEKAYQATAYKETYQRAYEVIHKYLDDVTIVWSTDESRLQDFALFYPGDRYVDWVGTNIYMPCYKQQLPYHYAGLSDFDFWYKSFQERKPLIISGLAVSHYSRVDHAYTVMEAIKNLQLFYEQAVQDYPRLRGIVYMDVDMAALNKAGNDDYRLTGHQQLITTMQDLSQTLKIHPQLMPAEEKEACYMKYSIKGVYFENQLYIPQEYMSVCFKDIPIRKITHLEDLTGEIYYSYEDISQYCDCYYKA